MYRWTRHENFINNVLSQKVLPTGLCNIRSRGLFPVLNGHLLTLNLHYNSPITNSYSLLSVFLRLRVFFLVLNSSLTWGHFNFRVPFPSTPTKTEGSKDTVWRPRLYNLSTKREHSGSRPLPPLNHCRNPIWSDGPVCHSEKKEDVCSTTPPVLWTKREQNLEKGLVP